MTQRFAMLLCLLLAFNGAVNARMAAGACSMGGGQHHAMMAAGEHHGMMAAAMGSLTHEPQSPRSQHKVDADTAHDCCDQPGLGMAESVGCDNHAACGGCAASAMPVSFDARSPLRASPVHAAAPPPRPVHTPSIVWRPPILG